MELFRHLGSGEGSCFLVVSLDLTRIKPVQESSTLSILLQQGLIKVRVLKQTHEKTKGICIICLLLNIPSCLK